MFTCSPTTGDRSVIAIEGRLGAGLGPGRRRLVTPDSFVVSKVTGEIVGRRVAVKAQQHVGTGRSGVRFPRGSARPAKQPVPDDAEICALARLGRRVEEHYGTAQDIEWAIARDSPPGEGVFLLQSRPETVWAQRAGRAGGHAQAQAVRPRAGPARQAPAVLCRSLPVYLTSDDVRDILRLLDCLPFAELDLHTDDFQLSLRRTADGSWTQQIQVLTPPTLTGPPGAPAQGPPPPPAGRDQPASPGAPPSSFSATNTTPGSRPPPDRGAFPVAGHVLPGAATGRAAVRGDRRGRQPRTRWSASSRR